MEISQTTLVNEALRGDLTAQKKLFEQFYAYVMSITLRYMATREEAEEVLNDVFLKVFDRLDQYDMEYPLKGWIRKIAINTSIDRLRSLKKLPFLVDLSSLIQLSSDDGNFIMEEGQDILPIIQELPPRYRAVFNLYVFEEYKHREIAELLGISEGTSKSNYARAKNILKKSLERKNKEERKQRIQLVYKSDVL